MNVLCLDIGSGTQDVLYFMENREIENCPKFILPSPAMMLAEEIKKYTQEGKNIYLYGENMGGGFKGVLFAHISQGLKVACSSDAAYALADNLDKVRKMGIEIVETPPEGFCPIYLTDFAPGFWKGFFNLLGLKYPDLIVVAAQDHGFFPDMSNRLGRFKIWKDFLDNGGEIKELLYNRPPENLTRLQTIHRITGGGLVADTGAAAILGAIYENEVRETSHKNGICIVNIGNSHTIAFLIYQDKVYGIYEHHTMLLSGEKLWEHLNRFKRGELSNKEIFEDQGHGCLVKESVLEIGEFKNTYVIGPKRAMLEGYPVKFIAPAGDMMLAGAVGLLYGLKIKKII
jgi:uncharacterized protein (DUF1786 family)